MSEPTVDAAFGNWFAGLFDGEGCFSVLANERVAHNRNGKTYITHESSVSATIALRADDKKTLEYIHRTLGYGRVSVRTMNLSRANPSHLFAWRAASVADLKFKFVPMLIEFPMRAKKSIEFPLFARAVDIAYQAKLARLATGRKRTGHYLPADKWEELKSIDLQMKGMRIYKYEEPNNRLSSLYWRP